MIDAGYHDSTPTQGPNWHVHVSRNIASQFLSAPTCSPYPKMESEFLREYDLNALIKSSFK